MVESELAEAQAAYRAVTTDDEGAQCGATIQLKTTDVLSTYREWRDKREEDGL